MRADSPSGTSLLVSFARGLGVEDRPLDSLAAELLPPWLGRIASAPRYLGVAGSFYRNALRASSFGLVDHAVLRTQAIDTHLVSALRSGIEQLVILGAGLDARAWRLPALQAATVFEVDHPATQRYKRKRIGGRVAPTDVRYVPVDFEKEQFSPHLVRAGFRMEDPSVWIWEGVTMYLHRQAIGQTLEQLTRLSASGSELAVTYLVPNSLPFGALGRFAIPAMFKAAGEPLKGALDSRELATAIAPNWDVVYDQDSRGWQELTRSHARPPQTFRSERLAVAKRRA